MSKLKELFDSIEISAEDLKQLAIDFAANPMSVMAKVHELNLPPDFIQKAMAIVMANPDEVQNFALSLGLSQEQIQEARAKLDGMGGGFNP